jgi:hypothetical protein
MLKAHLVGNLGQDPELHYSAEGRPVLTFRVASNYRTRTQEGAWEDRTEWVRVRVVGQRAESLSTLLMNSRSEDEQRRGDESGAVPRAATSPGSPGGSPARPAALLDRDEGDLDDLPF